MQLDDKNNYQKLIHDVGKNQIKITNIWQNTKFAGFTSQNPLSKGIQNPLLWYIKSKMLKNI